jgi:uncharacterized protein YggT (Ycf19 family)
MYTPPPLPIPIFFYLIYYGINVLVLAMLVRGFASMVHIDERYAFIRFLARLTDPFIRPLRRIVGQVWILDLSFIITLFILLILQTVLVQALPTGW